MSAFADTHIFHVLVEDQTEDFEFPAHPRESRKSPGNSKFRVLTSNSLALFLFLSTILVPHYHFSCFYSHFLLLFSPKFEVSPIFFPMGTVLLSDCEAGTSSSFRFETPNTLFLPLFSLLQ